MTGQETDLAEERRREIIRACAELYAQKSFREITLKDISSRTTFGRTSIYNYFRTKEEIFLGLLRQEYLLWTGALDAIRNGHDALDARGLAAELAQSLEERPRMLRLLSMNLYDMEAGSSMEALTEFKAAYGGSLDAVDALLRTFLPDMKPAEREAFLFAFLPFVYGIHPYVELSERQMQAMDRAGLAYRRRTVRELAEPCIFRLLRNGAE